MLRDKHDKRIAPLGAAACFVDRLVFGLLVWCGCTKKPANAGFNGFL